MYFCMCCVYGTCFASVWPILAFGSVWLILLLCIQLKRPRQCALFRVCVTNFGVRVCVTYFGSVWPALAYASVWLVSALCDRFWHSRLCGIFRVCVINFSVRVCVSCFASVWPTLAISVCSSRGEFRVPISGRSLWLFLALRCFVGYVFFTRPRFSGNRWCVFEGAV